MGKRKFTTYAAKMRQANREALATVAALVIIAVTWLSWGIGLADSDIELFSTPIWIIGGCVGTWLMAVLAARLKLADTVRSVLANGLNLLGVTAPEKM